MKLSDYADKIGIKYKTAWLWYKAGKIKGYQSQTGTIIITELDDSSQAEKKIAVYARVSSHEMKDNLEQQVERLSGYCAAKGWQVSKVVKEIGSGVNDSRPKFLKLLADESFTMIVVEHRDRATRFGFNYIKTLLGAQGRHIEVVNLTDTTNGELMEDLASIIYSFCARMYGPRGAKHKTEKITKELEDAAS